MVPFWCYGAVLVPSLNLRLTVAEHEVLRAAAVVSRRSLQQEVKARLFSGAEPLREGAAVSVAEAGVVTSGAESAPVKSRPPVGSGGKRFTGPDPKK